jgi:diacylglycerol kinase (ATP)
VNSVSLACQRAEYTRVRRWPVRVLLIHNPKAGYGQIDGAGLLELIVAAGHEPLYQSSEIDDLGAALDQAVDLIAVAGGDGTVTRVLKRAVGHDSPIVVLPLGTANNVARALGHVGLLEDLVRGWATGETRTFDLGRARAAWGHALFAESFGLGFLAATMVKPDQGDPETARTEFHSVTERMEEMLRASKRVLDSLAPVELTIETEDGTISGDFLWAEISTVGLVGPRLPLTDAEDLSDGRFVFASLPADERATFLGYLDARISGSAPARTGVVSERVTGVALRWRGAETHLDGRLITQAFTDAERHVQLTAVPDAVRVLRLIRPT